ncbi:hypothetical protein K1719_002690 [Acacia pycnantha]|nr:hypothetical protein K1719_002690 [Acacia pycnantha]
MSGLTDSKRAFNFSANPISENSPWWLDLQTELKLLMWESKSFVTSDSPISSPESGGSRGLLVDLDLQPSICPDG